MVSTSCLATMPSAPEDSSVNHTTFIGTPCESGICTSATIIALHWILPAVNALKLSTTRRKSLTSAFAPVTSNRFFSRIIQLGMNPGQT